MFETCGEIRDHYSDYLDGVCASDVMRSVRYHLKYCPACQRELDGAETVREDLQTLPRQAVPRDVDLRLRVNVSREIHRNALGRLLLDLDNRFRSLLLPATGGLVTALFFFCLILGSEVAPVSNLPDVPVSFVKPARVMFMAPFDFGKGDQRVVVVTSIGAGGQVMSYKIISGQRSPALIHSLDRLIYFSRYAPATAFGRPMDGQVVLSLSRVTIRG